MARHHDSFPLDGHGCRPGRIAFRNVRLMPFLAHPVPAIRLPTLVPARAMSGDAWNLYLPTRNGSLPTLPAKPSELFGSSFVGSVSLGLSRLIRLFLQSHGQAASPSQFSDFETINRTVAALTFGQFPERSFRIRPELATRLAFFQVLLKSPCDSWRRISSYVAASPSLTANRVASPARFAPGRDSLSGITSRTYSR